MQDPLRIMVVDDSSDAATSLAILLELNGHEVRIGQDGLEAVALAEEYRPDVALLDLGLPRLSGHDAARQIRATPWGRHMVLVAVTGWGGTEDRKKSREAGFDHHLVKPVDPGGLMRLLASFGPAPTSS